jgi:hypothetical protein
VCASCGERPDRIAADEAGADEWLPKDLAIDALVPTVRRYLPPRPLPVDKGQRGGVPAILLTVPPLPWRVRAA